VLFLLVILHSLGLEPLFAFLSSVLQTFLRRRSSFCFFLTLCHCHLVFLRNLDNILRPFVLLVVLSPLLLLILLVDSPPDLLFPDLDDEELPDELLLLLLMMVLSSNTGTSFEVGFGVFSIEVGRSVVTMVGSI